MIQYNYYERITDEEKLEFCYKEGVGWDNYLDNVVVLKDEFGGNQGKCV